MALKGYKTLFSKNQENLICQTGVLLWQHKLLDDAPKLQTSLVRSAKGILPKIVRLQCTFKQIISVTKILKLCQLQVVPSCGR